LAYAYVIPGNRLASTVSFNSTSSAAVDNYHSSMLSSKTDKRLRTLTTENNYSLLDSDCFKSKEAIEMSKPKKKSKSVKGIYQRGNTWAYTIYPTDSLTGLKKQKMVGGFPSEKAAIEAQARARMEIITDTYIPDSTLTLEKYLISWFDGYKHNLQPSTIQGYSNNIKLHIIPGIGGIRLSKLDRRIVSEFCFKLLDKGLSAKTIKYIYSTLRKALNEAVYDKIIPLNPCLGAKTPTVETYDSVVYDESQVKKLLDELKQTPIETAVMLSLLLGLRRGEVLGLRFSDCDFEKKVIHVRQQVTTIKAEYRTGSTYGIKSLKTKKSKRTIPIPDLILESILKQKQLVDLQKKKFGSSYQDYDLINCNPDGSPRSPQALLKQLKNLVRKLSLPEIRFHDLRHTCASILIDNDAEMKVVSDLLGHSTYSTTADIYTSILNKKKQPAEIMQSKFGSKTK